MPPPGINGVQSMQSQKFDQAKPVLGLIGFLSQTLKTMIRMRPNQKIGIA